jgi:hypothetical protein
MRCLMLLYELFYGKEIQQVKVPVKTIGKNVNQGVIARKFRFIVFHGNANQFGLRGEIPVK